MTINGYNGFRRTILAAITTAILMTTSSISVLHNDTAAAAGLSDRPAPPNAKMSAGSAQPASVATGPQSDGRTELLSKQELQRTLKKLIKSRDGHLLIDFLETQGFYAQLDQAIGSALVTDKGKTTGIAIPLAGDGKAWLVSFDEGTYFGGDVASTAKRIRKLGAGISRQKGDVTVIDLYDVADGRFINHDTLELRDGVLFGQKAGEVAIQSGPGCDTCLRICNLIQQYGCAAAAATLCPIVAVSCGGDWQRCVQTCFDIFMRACATPYAPCPQICQFMRYC